MGTRMRIANAPCSWGVLEFNLEGEVAGYEQVLDEIAATGYTGTELGDWGFMPTDPGKLRRCPGAAPTRTAGRVCPGGAGRSQRARGR